MEQRCKIAQEGMINMLQDMRNPLANIELSLELLQLEHSADQESACYNIIQKNTNRIAHSIHELCKCFFEQGFTLCISTENDEPIAWED